METHNGGDAGEDSETEDDDQSELFAAWASHFEKGSDGKHEDPDIDCDVDRAGCCTSVST